ncbi:MAG: prepilin-type N-terminal cleavage/methylation domain-containing protein [Gemmatimonadaceae bacterium]|nr:prepilin-type N-terminal cleavage/methylation domain-containing protein [Gemmatimonadaceae bacterium]
MKPRRGFSFVELLTVIIVLGLLVRIALPRYNHIRKKAQARSALADVRVVRDAVLNFRQDRGAWPTETGVGQVPTGLAQYLPQNFDFARAGYVLDYEMWPGGAPGSTDPGNNVVGLAVDTTDPVLAVEILKMGTGGLPHFASGTKTTFVYEGLGGIS